MTDIEPRIDSPSAENIIAEDVLFEAYLAGDYGQHVEWVDGKVISMAAITVQHAKLVMFLKKLFMAYVESTTGGMVLGDPVVMRVSEDARARQPDIQVILAGRLDIVQPTFVAGAADLVVEVVSPGSESTDRGEKFREYEQGGVREYWIIDPLRQEALFYVLGDDGLYRSQAVQDGVYRSTVLDHLSLTVATLWQESLPDIRATLTLVESMLADNKKDN